MPRDIKLEYYGKVSAEGEITLPKRMRKELVSLFSGHGIQVIVKRKRKRRSLNQNDYYWAVIVPYILRGFIELGNNLQEGNPEHLKLIHEFLKARFLQGEELHDANGMLHIMPPTTTILTTTEAEEYYDQCRQFAAEYLNTVIPLPNEQVEIW